MIPILHSFKHKFWVNIYFSIFLVLYTLELSAVGGVELSGSNHSTDVVRCLLDTVAVLVRISWLCV